MRSFDNLILKAPDGFDREIELTRQNRQLKAFLEQRARQTKTVPLDEVKTQLGLNEEKQHANCEW